MLLELEWNQQRVADEIMQYEGNYNKRRVFY